MRPATLDRVENDGSGSDINPRERKPKGPHSTTERSSGPLSSSLPPCSKLSRRGLETAECAARCGATPGLDSFCARRHRKSAGRGGRKPAARSNKRKGPSKKASQQERKCLRSWRRLENEGTAARPSRNPHAAKKIRARPRTPARQILCDQHRRTVAYSVPN